MSLKEEHAILLLGRGFDLELLARLGIVSDSRPGSDVIIIPYFKNETVVDHKFRTLKGERKMWRDKDAPLTLYNIDCIADKSLASEPLIITEGELDAWAAIQAGYPRTVSVPNGAPPPNAHDNGSHHLSYLDNVPGLAACREIILATDGDGPGIGLMNDLAIRLGRVRCKWLKYPQECKDLADALQKYGARGVSATIQRAQWMEIGGLYRMSELPPVPEVRAYETQFPAGLDKHYRIRPADFCVVTGVPSSGKTTVVNEIVARMTLRHKWRVVIGSFEQYPQRDYRRWLRTYFNGKYVVKQTEEEIARADEWIEEKFLFMHRGEDDALSLGWVLERMSSGVVRHGAKLCVIDPWNELEHERPRGMTETEYTGLAIMEIKRFATKHLVHVIVVAHPAKLQRGSDGKYPRPTLYDISGCHDEKTEVLTREGWKGHQQISTKDEVACFDLTTETLRWEKPSVVHKSHYEGPMVRFLAPSINLLVTPNHRMVVKPNWSDPVGSQVTTGIGRPVRWPKDCWSFCEAAHIPGSQMLIPLAAEMEGGDEPQTLRVGETLYDAEDLLRFLGWWIAEGHVNSLTGGIGLCQQPGTLADRIEATMTRLGIVYSWHESTYPTHPHWKPTSHWYIGVRANRDLTQWVSIECGKGAAGKKIPELIWGLSARLKRVFLDALIDGDGHRPQNRPGHASYSTISPALSDSVQRLAVECGYPCGMSVSNGGESHGRQRWQINIGRATRTHISLRTKRHISTEHYKGVVWCLTVPTGAFVTRRGGRVAITGNSAHWYNKPDVGVIVHPQEDGRRFIQVAKSRYHEEIGEPGEIAVKYNKERGCFEPA